MMLRVLIVDDETAARRTIARLLESIDFCTLAGEADNGARAIKAISLTAPDVVLADISMPGMDGIELAENIQRQYPKIKVIMLTMHSNFEYAVKAFRLGAVDYVLKDAYDIAPLKSALEKARKAIEAQNANETMNFESELRLQIKNKTYLGKYGRFVRFYSQDSVAEILADRFRRLGGDCYPVDENIWLAAGNIQDDGTYTYQASPVTASEATFQRFLLEEGEHFYFPCIFRLSGVAFDGSFSYASKEKAAVWYRNYIAGNMDSFPGDFVALCIDAKIEPKQAKQTLIDCVKEEYSASSVLIGQIERAKTIREIEIALRAALLTEQLSVVRSNRVIDDVKKYINEHLNEELTLRVLSEVVELSPSYLSTYFKQETGTGIKQYITDARMEMAAGLLKTTNMKVYAIAEKCGFVNVRYFSEFFSQHFGMTPQKYRLKGH